MNFGPTSDGYEFPEVLSLGLTSLFANLDVTKLTLISRNPHMPVVPPPLHALWVVTKLTLISRNPNLT